MKSASLVAVAVAAIGSASAFQSVPSALPTCPSTSSTALFEYIPTGFTKESWAKFKAAEAKKKAAQKNLGGLGPRGYKSRSFQSFQEALERGEAEHLMPVMNAEARIKKGELKWEDIPYMQRGGSWDNSDIKGAKKKRWLASDKAYENGGEAKYQSVSILGEGAGLDWTGTRSREGPVQGVKFSKNYKPPTVAQMKGQKNEEKPKKKLFGLF